MKTNFTARTAKGLRTIANNEHKGMNAAYRTLKTVWESNNLYDLTDAIEAAKNDGLTIEDFTAAFIIENLNGTNFCQDGVIGETKKGVFKARTTWTPGQLVDYVRRANKARLSKANKAEKESK